MPAVTSASLVVSSSVYIPTGSIFYPYSFAARATGSLGPITASFIGFSAQASTVVSSSVFITSGNVYNPDQASMPATGSLGPITASFIGASLYTTKLVTWFTAGTGSIGSGSTFIFTPTVFILTGLYAPTNTRETWEGNSVNTAPPSGHTLQDVTVMGIYPPPNFIA